MGSWTSWLCVILLETAVPRAAAQPSLSDLQASARQHSFDNQEAAALVLQREEEARQAWQGLLPVFHLDASYQRNQYAGIARLPPMEPDGASRTYVVTAKNQRDFTVSARLPLVNVASWQAIRVGKHNVEAQRAESQATRAEVALSVAKTYYELLAAEAVVLSASRTFKTAEENLLYVSTQRSAGSVSELDVQRAKAEVDLARESIAAAEYTRETVARSLETLAGLPIRPPFHALVQDDLRAEAPLESWLSHSASTPTAAAARTRARAEEARAVQQRARLLPSVELKASERFTNAPGFGASPYYSASVNAVWDLDLTVYTGSRVADAVARGAQVRAARASASRRDEIHDAWQQVRSLIVSCTAARAQLQVSQQAVAEEAQKYEAGTTLLIRLIEAQRDAFSAEVAALRADADLGAARATLRILAGHTPEPEARP